MLIVRDLIGIESLELKGLAGLAGDQRSITWAHVVDLPDPWKWVAAGTLVMTTGVGIPHAAAEQTDWLERLAHSEASALVVAPGPGAPELSPNLLEAADRLAFPVLIASFELEFIRLSQYVMESVLQTQRDRLKAIERLFRTYAEALRKESDPAGRLSILADTLGLGLLVEDAASGMAIVAPNTARGDEMADSRQVERVAIGGRVRANLVIDRKGKMAWRDPLLVRSLVGLLGVELERLMINRDTQREEGTALLRSLLENETDFAFVRPVLERRGLTGTLISLVIAPGKNGSWRPDEIHHAPLLHFPAPLFMQEDDVLLVLSIDSQAILDTFRREFGEGTRIGVSGPIAVTTGFRESVRQARLALTQAREIDACILRYGEVETGLIMAPKSLAEARALVGRYLGPLIEHDRTHEGFLLTTLMKFLDNNGNWKSTAFDLGIHRQTLVHRIKRIEQLTGIAPTTTNGTARFWIALQAGKNTKLLPGQKKD